MKSTMSRDVAGPFIPGGVVTDIGSPLPPLAMTRPRLPPRRFRVRRAPGLSDPGRAALDVIGHVPPVVLRLTVHAHSTRPFTARLGPRPLAAEGPERR
jgi:hypothetical protein